MATVRSGRPIPDAIRVARQTLIANVIFAISVIINTVVFAAAPKLLRHCLFERDASDTDASLACIDLSMESTDRHVHA
jgi:hypothetical protein